jgi:hypothetical protein
MRSERGQASAELMGLLFIVALIVAAIFATGLDGKISRAVKSSLCSIAGQCEAAAAPAPTGGAPAHGPSATDRDGDGIPNEEEERRGTDPLSGDTDGDGMMDRDEAAEGADPTVADTDGDGIDDGDEASEGLDPAKSDTDGDGLSDAEEIAAETDPTQADGDGEFGERSDGLTDAEEIRLGTDPNAYDSDGDGYGDGYEVRHGTDPLEDERSLLEKGFEALVLDDPISAIIPGGGPGKGVKKAVEGLLELGGKRAARIGGAETVEDAAKIRRERIEAIREQQRAKKPVPPAKRDSGETVLGKFPAYVKLSDERNARRFQIPDEVWQRMTEEEMWEANRKFLDRTISRGDDIVLATPIGAQTPPTGYYAKEIEYMLSKGYKVSPDGTRLIPPGS